jgi:2-iminobutanoate/2-iminopropanoate deaminase
MTDPDARRSVLPGAAHAPYSRAARWGDLLFTAGQVGSIDPPAPDIETQAREALDALDAVLRDGGATRETVLRVEAFLLDADDFDGWNDVFREYFPVAPPARTTVTTGFVLPGLRIEVQAIAGREAAA